MVFVNVANASEFVSAWTTTSSDILITASFSITDNTSFPLNFNSGTSRVIKGLSPYTITINLSSSSDTWSGLFYITGNGRLTFQYLNFTMVRGALTTYNSLFFESSSLSTFRPCTTIDSCSLTLPTDANVNIQNGAGGFVCNLKTGLSQYVENVGDNSISITNCKYTGPALNNGAVFVSGVRNESGYVDGDKVKIAIQKSFATVTYPVGTGYAEALVSGVFFGASMRYFANNTVSECGCIVQSLPNGGDGISIFFTNDAARFTISNSYVIITNTQSSDKQVYLANSLNTNGGFPNTQRVFDSIYFLYASGATSGTLNTWDQGNSSLVTTQNLGLQTGFSYNLGTTGTNNNTVLSYSANPNLTAPYQSGSNFQNTSIWTINSTSSPPILVALKSTRWIPTVYTNPSQIPKLISIYSVSSETQLVAWNGYDAIQVTQSFSISSNTSYPLVFLGTNDIIFEGQATGVPYIISVSATSTTTWPGLLRWSASTTAKIILQYIQMNMVQCQLVSNSSAFTSSTTVNPNVSFNSCGVQVGSPPQVVMTGVEKWSGFVCSLNTNYSFPGSGYVIQKCAYTGPLFSKGGSFISSGYSGGSTTTSTTVNIQKCVATIIQPVSIDALNGGGLCGDQMRLHTTIVDQCIVNFSTLPSIISNSFAGFFGQLGGSFTVTNSYVILTDSLSKNPTYTLYFITLTKNFNSTDLVQNCYFVRSGNDTTTLDTFSGASNFTINACAFQNGYTYTQSTTFTNNLTTYTYSTLNPQTISPFNTWSPSIWTPGQSPLILQAFQTNPYDPASYTAASDTPSLSNLCLFEGTRILTSQGYVNVENLTCDHRLITLDGRHVAIRNIYSMYNPTVPCVRIPPHFFKRNVPDDDVYISVGHSVCIDEKHLIPYHNQDMFEGLIKKAKEYGKSVYFLIEPEDYFTDILVASNMGVEGYGGSRNNDYGWLPIKGEQGWFTHIKYVYS